MKIIQAPTLARAHELVVQRIIEQGWQRITENGELTVELDDVIIRVENPLTEPMISPVSPQQRMFCNEYARNIIEGTHAKFEYDYHGRLFEWGEPPVDQIEHLIENLKSSPVSRRSVAITWNPHLDPPRVDVPCLQLVQCVIVNGKLNMSVVFRSNDMLSALGANMYGFARLQEWIAGRVGVPVGAYTHHSVVPHVYYRRDKHPFLVDMCSGCNMSPLPMICEECQGCDRK